MDHCESHSLTSLPVVLLSAVVMKPLAASCLVQREWGVSWRWEMGQLRTWVCTQPFPV